ncbi:MAG: hypothetical protein C4555_04650 [Dehalococcoidia bacterium]|nr:MAG: hypothetical protein C4555_04650 [Dehalococcoidia bacterium]
MMELKGQGKLFRPGAEELLSPVEYNIFVEPALNGTERWQGEMVSIESVKIADGGHYLIETEDGRRGICCLRKKVNKAVMGLPVRYFYHLSGGTMPEQRSR